MGSGGGGRGTRSGGGGRGTHGFAMLLFDLTRVPASYIPRTRSTSPACCTYLLIEGRCGHVLNVHWYAEHRDGGSEEGREG